MGATDDIMGVIPTMVVGYGAVKMTNAMFGGNKGRCKKHRHTSGCLCGYRAKDKHEDTEPKNKNEFLIKQ